MRKYTATFTCDRYLWDEFKTWANSIGSNASEQLSRFMETSISKEFEPETTDYIDSIIDQRIEKFVDERLNDLIDRRYMFGIKEPAPYTDYKKDTDKPELDNSTNNGANNTDNTEDTDNNTDSTEDTDNNKTPEIALTTYLKENYTDTDNTEDTDSISTENSLSGSKARKTPEPISGDKKYYLDREVAEIEGIKTFSVKRYRIGMRKPKDKTFFERWKLDKNGLKWKKINSDKE